MLPCTRLKGVLARRDVEWYHCGATRRDQLWWGSHIRGTAEPNVTRQANVRSLRRQALFFFGGVQ